MYVPPLGDALPKSGNRLTKWLGKSYLWSIGWRYEGEVPNMPKLVVIGAPHTSNWDFLLMVGFIFSLGLRFHWMAKHTLFESPLSGIYEWLGGVPVDRRAQHGAVEQIVAQFNQRQQFVLGLSPEGTRKKAARWRSGFWHIAQQAQVPILPVTIDYGRKVIGFLPIVQLSEDVEADIIRIQAMYEGVRGKFTDQF